MHLSMATKTDPKPAGVADSDIKQAGKTYEGRSRQQLTEAYRFIADWNSDLAVGGLRRGGAISHCSSQRREKSRRRLSPIQRCRVPRQRNYLRFSWGWHDQRRRVLGGHEHSFQSEAATYVCGGG